MSLKFTYFNGNGWNDGSGNGYHLAPLYGGTAPELYNGGFWFNGNTAMGATLNAQDALTFASGNWTVGFRLSVPANSGLTNSGYGASNTGANILKIKSVATGASIVTVTVTTGFNFGLNKKYITIAAGDGQATPSITWYDDNAPITTFLGASSGASPQANPGVTGEFNITVNKWQTYGDNGAYFVKVNGTPVIEYTYQSYTPDLSQGVIVEIEAADNTSGWTATDAVKLFSLWYVDFAENTPSEERTTTINNIFNPPQGGQQQGARMSNQILSKFIADSAIITSKLATGAVTADKLAVDSVITSKIQDGAVTTAKLASGAITNDKIASGIDAVKIGDGSVSNAKFQALSDFNVNKGTVQGQIDAEVSRASAAESSLSSALSSAVSQASSALAAESSRSQVAEASISAALAAEISRASAAESSLSSVITAEISRASAAESSLSNRIDLVLSNLDTPALDSLVEVVTAFQAADSSLQGAISSLSGAAGSGLTQEISRAQAAEASLSNALVAEVSRAEAAETSLSNALTAEISRASAAETSLAASIAAEETRATGVENSISSAMFKKDGSVTATGGFNMGGFGIGNLPTSGYPVSNAQAATKLYVDQQKAAEASRAGAAEQSLAQSISALQTSSNLAITAEQSRAQAAEGSLALRIATEEGLLTAEVSRAQLAESSLSTRAGVIETDLANEISRAIAAESSLNNNCISLSQSISAAGTSLGGRIDGAVSSATTAIANEVSRAQVAEASLASSISGVSSSLDAEVSRATAAEASLASRLSTDETNLANEISRAQAAEDTFFKTDSSRSISGTTKWLNPSNVQAAWLSADASSNFTIQAGTNINLTASFGKVVVSSGDSVLEVNGKLTNVTNGVAAQDAVTVSQLNAEQSRAQAAESSLSARVDFIASNVDPAAIDSLTEVVAAFQAADSSLNGAISALGTGSSSAIGVESSRAQAAETSLASRIAAEETALAAEISRAQAAETSLQSALSSAASSATTAISNESSRAQVAEASLSLSIAAEVSRATAAESSLATRVGAEESARASADSSLASRIGSEESARAAGDSSLSSRIDLLAAVTSAKESFALTSGQLTSVSLAHSPKANSVAVFVGRVALHEGEDYTVSGSTITWAGAVASGGAEALGVGDNVYVSYLYSAV